ncbi:hypothetical protein, partial [Paenibacillus sp. GbtcB18]|uniref:hypothetical protein n=1 Tax=Paenibacillus sp. GbtcB18 TaxID=2824763 RepID=UPI001C2F21D2
KKMEKSTNSLEKDVKRGETRGIGRKKGCPEGGKKKKKVSPPVGKRRLPLRNGHIPRGFGGRKNSAPVGRGK